MKGMIITGSVGPGWCCVVAEVRKFRAPLMCNLPVS